jgi:hypothetical protein
VTTSLMKSLFTGDSVRLEWLEIPGLQYTLQESQTLLAPWSASTAVPELAAD